MKLVISGGYQLTNLTRRGIARNRVVIARAGHASGERVCERELAPEADLAALAELSRVARGTRALLDEERWLGRVRERRRRLDRIAFLRWLSELLGAAELEAGENGVLAECGLDPYGGQIQEQAVKVARGQSGPPAVGFAQLEGELVLHRLVSVDEALRLQLSQADRVVDGSMHHHTVALQDELFAVRARLGENEAQREGNVLVVAGMLVAQVFG